MSFRSIAHLLRLPMAEKLLLLQAWGLLLFIGAGLKLLPLNPMLRLFKRVEGNTPSMPHSVGRIPARKIVWAVSVASRYWLFRRTCLNRALTARILLARHHYTTNLRIGVRRGDGGALEAHAWLESDGAVVIGGGESLTRFTILPTMDGKLM